MALNVDTKNSIMSNPSPYNNNHILFDLIKQHKWSEFTNHFDSIDLTKEYIDINIRDNGGNYLIQFAILNNQKQIVSLLINKGAKLDILDTDERGILYIPIKYSYNDILELLLHFNNTSIGISLTELQDRLGYTPFHYAIMFKNEYALDKLLSMNLNINKQNKAGYTGLHLCVLSKVANFIEKILQKNPNLNLLSKDGETVLHLACSFELYKVSELLLNKGADPNITDFGNELTVLAYVISLNRLDFVKLLISHSADPNIQDQYGSTALHHCVYEDRYEILDFILNNSKKVNYNIVNIDGKSILHLILESKSIHVSKKTLYIKKIISKSNLNLQDINGNTSLFLLVKYDLWKDYISELSCKKLDIYKHNRQNQYILDIIQGKSDKDLFIKTVINGFYCYIKKQKSKLDIAWQDQCRLNVHNETKCRDMIKKQIETDLISIPDHKKYHIEIFPGDLVKFGTYTGIVLDVLCGLIYLMRKWKYIQSPLSTDFIINKTLIDYYKSLGINTFYDNKYTNFEIIWMSQKIFLPTSFAEKLKEFIKESKENKNVRFFVSALGIELNNESHANYIIYDALRNELERFEPHGARAPVKFNYNSNLLDATLIKKFTELIPSVKMISPNNYLPKIGYQVLDSSENNQYRNIGDPGGFCALWSLWYADMRLTYPDIPRKKLIDKSIETIRQKGYSFKTLIRNYSAKIVEIRDLILQTANVSINQWLNDDYTDSQLLTINGTIKQIIKDLRK